LELFTRSAWNFSLLVARGSHHGKWKRYEDFLEIVYCVMLSWMHAGKNARHGEETSSPPQVQPMAVRTAWWRRYHERTPRYST
jgi:hypothetical protein